MSSPKRITPILQSELIRQLGKIADALDTENLPLAWRTLQTMTSISPPEIRKECKKTIEQIKARIAGAQAKKGIDLYQTRTANTRTVMHIFANELRPLHEKIMDLLYTKGYLEVIVEVPIGKEIP